MVRAKFRVNRVDRVFWTDKDGKEVQWSENVRAFPVYSDDPASENRAFWTATPSGGLFMAINNPAAFGKFEEGKEYYLDLTPAG